jgi:serine/threonine-protein kinase
MAKPADCIVGRTIAGKFHVEGLIGSGAMGAVYRAHHVALGKTVAIKVLHGEHADEPAFIARFQREAKAASRLNHPNSMQVLDFGAEPDGLLYIAMEYLDGRSLHRVLREERPLSPERIADILMQTLAALAVAHDMGVVHRDLKPENIVILRGTDDDGRPKDIVKVCDFGIAKLTDSRAYRGAGERDSAAPVTTAGFLVGTPEYMSPEQGRGEPLDLRSDLYSVGVVLFEMLTGHVPFDAENAIGIVLKHITQEPPRPSQSDPGVDRRLEAICVRALRKGPLERYQTAREMRAELRAAFDVRALQPSVAGVPGVPSAPGGLPPEGAPDRAAGYAATVGVPAAPPLVARAADDGAVKPTLVGTSTAIRSASRRITTVAVAALLLGVLATGATLGLLARSGARRSPASAAAIGVPSGAPLASIVPLDSAEGELPPLEEGPAPHAGAARGTVHAARTVAAAPKAPSAGLAAAAGPSAHTAVQASAPPSSSAPSVAPPPDPAPTPATLGAAAPADPDPAFDPNRGYVELGLINAQGVRESAVRSGLRGVGLATCYRNALKARGARAPGVATLDVSVDENGVTRSAIVSGANFLPGLARCVQGAATSLSVPKSQVDAGGGTAEVTLAFKVP